MPTNRPDQAKRPDWYPEPIPGFDVMKWKQEMREQMRRETEGMTSEEFCEYLRQGSKEFNKDCTEQVDEIHSPFPSLPSSFPMSNSSVPTL